MGPLDDLPVLFGVGLHVVEHELRGIRLEGRPEVVRIHVTGDVLDDLDIVDVQGYGRPSPTCSRPCPPRSGIPGSQSQSTSAVTSALWPASQYMPLGAKRLSGMRKCFQVGVQVAEVAEDDPALGLVPVRADVQEAYVDGLHARRALGPEGKAPAALAALLAGRTSCRRPGTGCPASVPAVQVVGQHAGIWPWSGLHLDRGLAAIDIGEAVVRQVILEEGIHRLHVGGRSRRRDRLLLVLPVFLRDFRARRRWPGTLRPRPPALPGEA